MNNLEKKSIEHYRERKKMDLELFVQNLKENSFKDAVSDLIDSLETKLNDEVSDFLEFLKQDENANQNYHLDTYSMEDKLLALSEMNVVYSYKDFEISIKKLIGHFYGIDTKQLYRWGAITDFLKSKNIKYSELKGYNEVNQLRKVNNLIKHTTKEIDEKIKSISEFSQLNYMRHYELSDFFNRIKEFPYLFLDALSSEIYKDLYDFDNDRLRDIAELYAKRMDKETAYKFIEELKKNY